MSEAKIIPVRAGTPAMLMCADYGVRKQAVPCDGLLCETPDAVVFLPVQDVREALDSLAEKRSAQESPPAT